MHDIISARDGGDLVRDWLVQLRGNETQTAVAQRARLSQNFYSNVENGVRNPSVRTAKRIAEALGFSWTKFFEEEATTGH